MSGYVCPWCGPCTFPHGRGQFTNGCNAEPICPTCDLTSNECAYADRIIADSDAVFRQEWREFEAKRRIEKARAS